MKTCTTCGAIKSPEEFQVRRASRDGRTASCKACLSDRDARRANLPHRVQSRRAYQSTEKGKEAHLRGNNAYRNRRKDRLAAHNAVAKALLRGHITRWPCQVCGASAEAHHPDYQNRLGVVWLCDEHHKEAHRVTKECDREAARLN